MNANQMLTEYMAPSGDAPKPRVQTSYPVFPRGCRGRLEVVHVVCLFELCLIAILSSDGRAKPDRALRHVRT